MRLFSKEKEKFWGRHEADQVQDNPYRYAGYQYDHETGLYYLIARYYQPEHGVFLSLDPNPGDSDDILTQNGYSYVSNNPVKFVDPDGMKQLQQGLGSGGGGFIIKSPKGTANVRIISSIKKDSRLVKAAEEMGKDTLIQKEANNLVAKLQQGNSNPGIGNNSLGFGGIHELRSKNGARVYFRNINGGVEILAKSNKKNQGTVIKVLRQLYGK